MGNSLPFPSRPASMGQMLKEARDQKFMEEISEMAKNPHVILSLAQENDEPVPNEQRERIYLSDEFKGFMLAHMRKELPDKYVISLTDSNEKDVKIPARIAKKMYWKIYSEKFCQDPRVSMATKVMMHPDISKTDYAYVKGLLENKGIIMIPAQILTFSIMIGYASSKRGLRKLNDSPAAGLLMISLLPMASYLFSDFGHMKYVDYKVDKIGLRLKYKVV